MGSKQDRKAPGHPPGLLVTDPAAAPSRINVIAYGPDSFVEERDITVGRIAELLEKHPVMWLDVVGLGDADKLNRVGEAFGLHPLVVEDIAHVTQRSKLEEYEDYNFVVLRMVNGGPPDTEQLAMVLKERCVLTFQERSGDSLEPVRERIRRNMGRMRRSGADYLAYALIDAVVDHYAPLIEWYEDHLDMLERHVLSTPNPNVLGQVYELKCGILDIRRVLLPMRDAIGQLQREEVPLFSPDIAPYLRDCYDHVVRYIEHLEFLRENALGLMDLYMSSVSHRMNEVMKVLTIIATIFIPLSFIAGLYGMNFDPRVSPWNMPELGWRWGYPFALLVMAAVTGVMLLYFRRKGWLRADRIAPPLPPRRPAPPPG